MDARQSFRLRVEKLRDGGRDDNRCKIKDGRLERKEKVKSTTVKNL